MRIDLLGLPLEDALSLLEGEGIRPEITQTVAPRRQGSAEGMLRVVHATDDGGRLTVSRFLDPIAAGTERDQA